MQHWAKTGKLKHLPLASKTNLIKHRTTPNLTDLFSASSHLDTNQVKQTGTPLSNWQNTLGKPKPTLPPPHLLFMKLLKSLVRGAWYGHNHYYFFSHLELRVCSNSSTTVLQWTVCATEKSVQSCGFLRRHMYVLLVLWVIRCRTFILATTQHCGSKFWTYCTTNARIFFKKIIKLLLAPVILFFFISYIFILLNLFHWLTQQLWYWLFKK